MIRGKHITLRTVRETDLDALFTALSDLASRGDSFPLSLMAESAFKREFHAHGFWSNDAGRLLIGDAAERLLGSLWYFHAVPYYDGLEIGYQLFDVGSRNTGVMTEALALFAQYLFASRKINRLQLAMMRANVASKRVAEKRGFTFEGVARGAIFHRGANHDLEIYAMVREDRASSAGTPRAA